MSESAKLVVMKPSRLDPSFLIALLPVGACAIYLFAGTAVALRSVDLPQTAEDSETPQAEQASSVPPAYVKVPTEVFVSLDRGSALRVEYALAVDPSMPKEVIDDLKEGKSPLVAPIGDAVQIVLSDISSPDEIAAKRAQIAEAIANTLNEELVRNDHPPHVREALIQRLFATD